MPDKTKTNSKQEIEFLQSLVSGAERNNLFEAKLEHRSDRPPQAVFSFKSEPSPKTQAFCSKSKADED